jgi:hypothetical protein
MYAVGVHNNNTLHCSWPAFVFRFSSCARRQLDESKIHYENTAERTQLFTRLDLFPVDF